MVDPVNDLPLINIFFHAPESALSHSFAQDLGDDLYIFNKRIEDTNSNHPTLQIDDGSPENLKKMKFFAEEIMEENQQSFDELCEFLIQNYDRKSGKKREEMTEKKSIFSFLKGN